MIPAKLLVIIVIPALMLEFVNLLSNALLDLIEYVPVYTDSCVNGAAVGSRRSNIGLAVKVTSADSCRTHLCDS